MNACLVPVLLLLTAAPLIVRADESPPAQETPADTASIEAEQLPYGAGYEARRRAVRLRLRTQGADSDAGEEHARTQAATPAETRAARRDADHGSARREARREARERWGAHGGRRN